MTGKPWTEEQKEERRLARLEAQAGEITDADKAWADGVIARSGDLIGDEEPAEEVAEPVDDLADARKRLLAGLSPEDAALVTDDDLRQIIAEEEKKARDEKRKRALATIRSRVSLDEKVRTGLLPASAAATDLEIKRREEQVRFRVNLPSGGGAKGFRVDGFLYENGMEYVRSRAVFDSLHSNHYKAHFNEIQFRTLDQHKPGNSAAEIMASNAPAFEVPHG